jgi:RNA-binding protein YhbY
MAKITKIQLGKNGITDNFISTLKAHFNKCSVVKVVVLRSAREERADTKRYAEEILKKMGEKFITRVVGFTIAIKKVRNPNRLKEKIKKD